MDYPFYVNDFDRIRNHREKYPVAGKIFEYPVAFWFGVKKGKKDLFKVHSRITRLLNRADPLLPIMVIYNLPNRDMGNYSKGGASSDDTYLQFIETFAKTLGDRQPIVIYEPDGLPHTTLMEKKPAQKRLELMKQSLSILRENCNAHVYADIGHSNWLDPETAGKLLNSVCNSETRGFSVNVSNYRTTKESVKWAERVREYADVDYYVVDTSRNGAGPYGNEWCNPPERALGIPPTTHTQLEHCDAYLWIKVPGESDGTCNGGPPAGKFWLEYARDLVINTSWIK
jgi:endoglucanase